MKRYFSFYILIFLNLYTVVFYGNSSTKPTSKFFQNKNMIVLPWIENKGQYDSEVAFASKTKVADIKIIKNGVIKYFFTAEDGERILFSENIENNKKLNRVSSQNKTNTRFNFFKKHKNSNSFSCFSYNTIDYGEIFHGISMKIVTKRNNIEKIFELQPFSNPQDIRLKLRGVTDICENEKGELQLEINGNIVAFTTPNAWQEINKKKIDVSVRYSIKDDFVYGFKLGEYNPEYPLYIDPLLSSTFIGGSQMDFVKNLAVSKTGKVYAGGVTSSVDFPATQESYDSTFNESEDIFIAVFDSSLTNLEVCSFIGGQRKDILVDMMLDDNDNVYFCGWTDSEDYPVTPLAYDTTFNNMGKPYSDIIISCLDSKLSEIKYSTFIGSDLGDKAIAFDLDGNDNLIVTGISGGGIPIVGPQFYPDTKEFIFFKIDTMLKNLLATNSIQTDSLTIPIDLIAEDSLTVFITGYTEDPSFPVSPNAFMGTLAGNSDVFIIRLSNNLSVIEESTLLGGKKDEVSSNILLDKKNNIILTGTTNSKSFPVSINAYDTIFSNAESGINDIFICMLDYDLTKMESSTFLGGLNEDIPGQLFLDDSENIYLVGTTNSMDFPVFCNSYDDSFNGGRDGFLVKFSPKLENLLGSTFIGGNDDDYCYGLAMDREGNLYSAGFTSSVNFPVFSGFDDFYNGDSGDGFIIRMTSDLQKPYPCCSQMLEPVPESGNHALEFNIVWSQSVGATGYLLSIGTLQDSFNFIYRMDMGNSTNYFLSDFECDDTVYIKILPYNAYGINKNCETNWVTTKQSFKNNQETSICEGDSIEWQGNYYYDSGIYSKNYTDIYGCDSSYNLILNVYPNYFDSYVTDICEGDSYYWEGEYYVDSGEYTKHYTTINGCDSILKLKLNVFPAYFYILDTTICKGDTVFWQNYSITSSGLYTSEHQTIFGCDSIYQLNLTVLPSYYNEEEAEICEGDTIYWQGMVLDSAGIYTAQYSTIGNCDSVYRMNLIVNSSYNYKEDAIICSTDTLEWQGISISESGIYYASYKTIKDCDSIYQLNLTVLPSYYNEEEAEICEGDTIYWQGMVLDSAGIYTAQYSTVGNCDSIHTLDLIELPNYYFEESVTLCEGDTLEWQGMNIDSSGIYYSEYSTVKGCDSIFKINVETQFIDDTIFQSGDTLFAVYDSTLAYQWVICSGNDTIYGANDYKYITSESNSYAVILNNGVCSKISECINVVNSGTNNNDKPKNIKIYPNPVFGNEILVDIKNISIDYIIIRDFTGKNIKKYITEKQLIRINTSKLTQGIYFISIFTKGKVINKKFVVIK